MFCYVLAGVVGCVQSIHGQARRVLVRRDPVSQGRYDPARVARIGVAGKARFVELGLGELRLGEAGLVRRVGFWIGTVGSGLARRGRLGWVRPGSTRPGRERLV